ARHAGGHWFKSSTAHFPKPLSFACHAFALLANILAVKGLCSLTPRRGFCAPWAPFNTRPCLPPAFANITL
ncbi:MAG: hypothetical protein ACYTEK_08965, partial [Planctomycetota bacterium]